MTSLPAAPSNQTVQIHDSNCAYTYSIPSTSKFTSDLKKPQSVNNQFGYSYSGKHILFIIF
jgi:hypothetical protein